MARFEVGEAFLQVVASVKDIHKTIAAEVAKIRDIEIDVTPNMEGFREKVAAGLAGLQDVDVNVKPDTTGFREKVRAAVAGIGSMDVPVSPNVDTTRANAQVGAFATQLRAKLEAATTALGDIHMTADATDVERKIASIRAELATLQNQRIGVDIDAGAALAKIKALEAELAALGARSPNIQVKVDVDAARANLRALSTEVESLFSRFQNANLGSTMFAGIGAAIIPLIQSVGQLSGALGLIPAVATGVATALGAVVIGSQGLGDAFKAQAAAEEAATAASGKNVTALQQQVDAGAAHITSLKAQQAAGQNVTAQLQAAETAQKANVSALNDAKGATDKAKDAADAYAATLNNLAPSARAFVSAVVQLKPAFNDLRLDVQQHLFEGIGDALLQLGNTALPVVRTGLTQMADGLSEAARNVASFAASKEAVAAYKTIFDNIGSAAHQLAGAVQPILQIFTDVAEVGSQFLPELAAHFADAARSAAEFVRNAKETGQLKQWIQTGLDAVRELWGAFKDVVAIIRDLTVMPGFGPNFLEALHAVTTAIRWFIENVPGATTAVQLFFDAWLFAKVLQGLTSMASTIRTVVVTAIELATGKVKLFGTASTEAAVASEAAATRAGNAWKAFGLLVVGVIAAVEADKILPPAPPGDTSIFAKARNELHDLAQIVNDPKQAIKDLEDELSHFGDQFDFANSPVKHGLDMFIQGFKDAGTAADSFGTTVTAVLNTAVAIAGQWAGKTWEAVISAKDNASGVIQTVIASVAAWIGRAWNAVVSATDTASGVIQSVIASVAAWIGRAWNAVVSATDTASGVIQAVIGAVGGWVGRAWNAVVSATDAASAVIQTIIGKAGEYVGRAWNATIGALDNASGVIRGIINLLNSIKTSITTVVTTIYRTITGGAAGMIASPMAAGGVLPMAAGGALRPNMPAGLARIVPPNTFRLIGDRPSGDEAFIPINNSPRSVALLGVTANRMGFGLAPMHRGGYHPRDQRAWEWLEELLRRWRGDRGGGGIPRVPGTIGTAQTQLRTMSMAFGGSGGAASYIRRVVAPLTEVLNPKPAVPSPPSSGGGRGGRGGGGGGRIYIDTNSALIEELLRIVRNEVRRLGGDVQDALGPR